MKKQEPKISRVMKMMRGIAVAALITAALLFAIVLFQGVVSNSALAQTALPLSPNQQQAPQAPQAPLPEGYVGRDETTGELIKAAPDPAPVARSIAESAERQSEGDYPPLLRQGQRTTTSNVPTQGGFIQEAWNDAGPNAGYVEFKADPNRTYKIRIREFMTTTLMLPDGDEVWRADVGDPTQIEVQLRRPNILTIRPNGFGFDTNITVFAGDNVYPIYVRAEGHNSVNLSDLIVRIIDPYAGSEEYGEYRPSQPIQGGIDSLALADPSDIPVVEEVFVAPDGPDALPLDGLVSSEVIEEPAETKADRDAEVLDDFRVRREPNDFVERVEFDPGKLHGFDDYTLWGDEELAPVRVFRDDFFTYIQYAQRYDQVDLPVAFVVVDGIDELVNTRVQGRTYIVESTSSLITLKSGNRYLCIKYEARES